MDVKKEDNSKVAEIQITDKEGVGQAKLTTCDPNKRTKIMTIQISKLNKGELRHVEILATQIVKPLLDKLLNGDTVKNLIKIFFKDPNNQYVKEEGDSYECPHCSRTFKMERAMKSHVTKTHKIKFEPV